jgi:hypothetical protein
VEILPNEIRPSDKKIKKYKPDLFNYTCIVRLQDYEGPIYIVYSLKDQEAHYGLSLKNVLAFDIQSFACPNIITFGVTSNTTYGAFIKFLHKGSINIKFNLILCWVTPTKL